MSSFYDKKRMIPYISSMFLPSFKVYTVLFILMKTVKLLLFLTIWLARYVDFGRVTSKDFLFTWRSAGCINMSGILQSNSNQWVIQLSARKANCLFVRP